MFQIFSSLIPDCKCSKIKIEASGQFGRFAGVYHGQLDTKNGRPFWTSSKSTAIWYSEDKWGFGDITFQDFHAADYDTVCPTESTWLQNSSGDIRVSCIEHALTKIGASGKEYETKNEK